MAESPPKYGKRRTGPVDSENRRIISPKGDAEEIIEKSAREENGHSISLEWPPEGVGRCRNDYLRR